MTLESPHLILASASPRRRELLDQIGIRYHVHPVNIDEQPFANEQAADYVNRVTKEKALAANQLYTQQYPGLPVLAADTAVVLEGMIMGKPKSEQHALQMLSVLSGKTHQVFSAVCLYGKQHLQTLSVTDVTFRRISEEEMLSYWLSGEAADKAGAYAIQGLGCVFVQSIHGSYSGVMGLPLFETARLLKKAGIKTLL